MKITEVIKAFKQAKITYKNALKEKALTVDYLYNNNLQHGICCYLSQYSLSMTNIFCPNIGHYKNYSERSSYIFETPFYYITYNTLNVIKVKECLQFRYNFLKKEIPYLKELIKKGYTHI